MENFRADKMDTLCKKNYHTNGNINSFEYIPEYLKEFLTKLTFIEQNPVFTFPNGFEISLLGKFYNEKYSWEVSISLGDFKFDSFPDYLSCNFNSSCGSLAELLAGLYFVPSTDTQAWIKTLQNSRRKTWKTSEEIINSDKFKKAFEKAVEQGKKENLKTMPFIKPYLNDEIENISEYDTAYRITYKFGIEVFSQKWTKGYQIKIKDNPKIIIIDSIEDVNKLIEEHYNVYKEEYKANKSVSETVSEEERNLTDKNPDEITPQKDMEDNSLKPEISNQEENLDTKIKMDIKDKNKTLMKKLSNSKKPLKEDTLVKKNVNKRNDKKELRQKNNNTNKTLNQETPDKPLPKKLKTRKKDPES